MGFEPKLRPPAKWATVLSRLAFSAHNVDGCDKRWVLSSHLCAGGVDKYRCDLLLVPFQSPNKLDILRIVEFEGCASTPTPCPT